MKLYLLVTGLLIGTIFPVLSYADLDKQKIIEHHQNIKNNIMRDVRKEEKSEALSPTAQTSIASELSALKLVIQDLKDEDINYADKIGNNDNQRRKYLESRNEKIHQAQSLLFTMTNKYMAIVQQTRHGIVDENPKLVMHFGAIKQILDYIMTDAKSSQDRQDNYDIIATNLQDNVLPF